MIIQQSEMKGETMALRFENLQPGEYVAARLAAGDEEGALIAADEQYAIGCLRAAEGQDINFAWPINMLQGYKDFLAVRLWSRSLHHWSDAYCLQEEP